MARKNRQHKSKVQRTSSPPKNEMNNSSDNELECKNCDLVFSNVDEKQSHENECSTNSSTCGDGTSNEKTKFLCTVIFATHEKKLKIISNKQMNYFLDFLCE